MLQKLLSHAAIYGLAAQVPRLAGVLALPIITPFLTTTDYGVAGVITAYMSALGILQSLGLSVVMVNSYAKYPTRYKWIWRQLHGFLLLWSVGYGLLLGTVLYWVIPAEAAGNLWELIVLNVTSTIFFNSIGLFGGHYYQMQQRPFPIALHSFLMGGLVVGLNIYTIAYLKLGYMGWFYANFLGSVFSVLFLGYLMYVRERMWPIFRINWERIRSSLRVSLPLLPHSFSFFLLDTSDRLVLDVLRVPVARIGSYNVASSFGLYFSAASHAVVQAAMPVYMQLYGKEAAISDKLQARKLTFSLQVLFLLGTSVLGLWMKEIFELLIKNETLQEAYPLAIVILMGYNYKPMYLAAINQLVYREKTSVLWKISTVAGVGNVLLNLILVPVYGIEAAAFTTFAALMFMGYAGYMLKEYRQLQQINYFPWFWLLLTVFALLGVYTLAGTTLVQKAALTGVGLGIGLVYFFVERKR
ncbi:lipopolysaccharide biosynthesis protein [Pontibacter sp. CAU 1760]